MNLLPFDRWTVGRINPLAKGVYAISNAKGWIYVGKGELRNRLMAHLNGDIPCISRSYPTHFFIEVISGDASRREKELILQLRPACNSRVG